jgi:predicted Fe-Mo cluster-binding NifX family protein
MKSRWSLSLGLALVLMPVLVSAADPLLIAVASDNQEATSLVGNFAARSRYYLLFSQTLELVQVVQNPFLSEEERAAPLIVDYLAQKGVGVIVAGRFGPPMIKAMNRKEMRYIQYSGVAREAVQRVINFLRPPEGKTGGQ